MPVTSAGAARQYVESLLGGAVAEQDGTASMTTTPAQIVPNDPDCCWLLMINVGSDTCYIGLDPSVSSSNGIILNANGGFISFNVTQDMTLPARQWFGVAGSSTSSILFIKVRRFNETVGTAGG